MSPALAITDDAVTMIVVAVVAAVAGIVNTVLLRRQRAEMTTGNGIRLGPLVASIADRLFHHETTLDSIDLQVHEVREKVEEVDSKIVGHIEETRPLVEVFLKEHPELRKEEEP